MRNLVRKLLATSLAVVYGGISLVGYGLHEFSPAHARTAGHAHVHAHTGCTHHHHHVHGPIPDEPGFSDAHECDICHWLDQVRSELPQLVLIDCSQPLVDQVVAAHASLSSETPLGLHVPRGPPALAS